MSDKRNGKTGPSPDRLKLEGDWEDRVSDALKKPTPKGGVPERDKTPKPRKKKPSGKKPKG